MNGSERVAAQAATDPNGPALILDDRTLTWAEVDGRVEACARRLSALGAGAGDRVAVAVSPSAEAADLVFGLARIGAVLVPLPVDAGAHREILIERTKPSLVLTLEDLAATTPSAAPAPHPVASPDAQQWIIFTSGSEGAPKGVILTAGNLEASARGAARVLRLLPGDRWIACMPLHHVAGLSVFRRAAEVGFAVVPVSVFDPLLVMQTVERSNATAVSLVPTMLARMIEAGWRGHPTLRFVLLGGGACSQPLLNSALDLRIPIALTYGLTEASSQVTTLPPWESRGRMGTVGRAIPGVAIRTGEAPDRPAPAGSPGPIWVSGATVATESIDGALPLRGGWLPTGDLGRLDTDGSLTVLGRADDVIITGGEKVAPQEVENALLLHPGVEDVAVVGIPDEEWGQRAVAVVVVRGDDPPVPDPSELRDFLKKRLAYHKVPREIAVLDALPRTGLDKVDRAALRHQLKGRE